MAVNPSSTAVILSPWLSKRVFWRTCLLRVSVIFEAFLSISLRFASIAGKTLSLIPSDKSFNACLSALSFNLLLVSSANSLTSLTNSLCLSTNVLCLSDNSLCCLANSSTSLSTLLTKSDNAPIPSSLSLTSFLRSSNACLSALASSLLSLSVLVYTSDAFAFLAISSLFASTSVLSALFSTSFLTSSKLL